MRKPLYEIQQSPIQGLGAFAARSIRKGTQIIEYVGERITTEEANARYEDSRNGEAHVLLFTVDKRTVIDAGVGGNEARFFNHSCEPNCQAVAYRKRVYFEALRTIAVGEELTIDYRLDCGEWPTDEGEQWYACLCGADSCRGTMMAPPPAKRRRGSKDAGKQKEG